MSATEPLFGTFHNGITGETIRRELTADEIAELPEPTNEDLPIVG
jgi:hypothetical protein